MPPLDTNTELIRPLKNKYRHTLYNCREIGKTILTKKELNTEKKKSRHEFCGFATHKRHVTLVKGNENKHHFNGVASCGCIWRCPVCSMKILKGRAKELYSLTSAHLKLNQTNEIGFLTLTVKHNRGDLLEDTLDKLLTSWTKLQNHKFFRNIKLKGNYLGQVKALEITHTKLNGWHPHLHILLFWENLETKTIETYQNNILNKWVSFTKGSLKAQDQKIVYNKDVLEYVTKWDSIQELTNDFAKNSNGIKPFQLLDNIYNSVLMYDYKTLKSSNNRAKAMFLEYVEATKGKHRIHISRKLTQIYQIVTKTDEELVKEINIKEIILSFEREVWALINKNDLQPYLLDICDEQKEKDNITNEVFKTLSEFENLEKIEIETKHEDKLIKNKLIKIKRV